MMSKKIILGSLASVPVLGVAMSAGATSTTFAIPSIGDLLGYAIDAASPFLTALWPIIGLIVGIGFVAWLISKIIHIF